jgi:oligopeptide/dipeptide ABC transporter ATP-binding protein
MTAPLLELRALQVRFTLNRSWFGAKREVHALNAVDLQLAPGESLGLVGESGCGKTTLARAVLGLQRPTAGQVLVAGQDLNTAQGAAVRALRRRVQMVFQDPFTALNPRLSAEAIVAEPLHNFGIGDADSRKAAVLQLFAQVGLREDQLGVYPDALSGGQRQRLGIARALALKPELLVADEPVSALDVSVRAQVLNLLARLRREYGLAMLFVSHDLAVVRHVCDRVAVMYMGRIVEQGRAAELFAAPRHPYTQALIAAIPQPDPRRCAPRERLKGDLPSPLDVPAGCPFQSRCPLAMPRCGTETPALAGGVHRVACHAVALEPA